jgi:hypothetical protein
MEYKEWTKEDTRERLHWIEQNGYNGVGEFEVRLMLSRIKDLEGEIKQRWREKDGHLIHDGDCFFWDRKVCTCGLIHHLTPLSGKEQTELYPQYAEDWAQHHYVMDYLLDHPPEPMSVMTEEQSKANLRFLEEIFGFRDTI